MRLMDRKDFLSAPFIVLVILAAALLGFDAGFYFVPHGTSLAVPLSKTTSSGAASVTQRSAPASNQISVAQQDAVVLIEECVVKQINMSDYSMVLQNGLKVTIPSGPGSLSAIKSARQTASAKCGLIDLKTN